MLKIRLMGTKNDIKWFGKILRKNPKVEVQNFPICTRTREPRNFIGLM